MDWENGACRKRINDPLAVYHFGGCDKFDPDQFHAWQNSPKNLALLVDPI